MTSIDANGLIKSEVKETAGVGLCGEDVYCRNGGVRSADEKGTLVVSDGLNTADARGTLNAPEESGGDDLAVPPGTVCKTVIGWLQFGSAGSL